MLLAFFIVAVKVADVQPLRTEFSRQPSRAIVAQHAMHVSSQHFRLRQRTRCGRGHKEIVWHARPKKVTEPCGKFPLIHGGGVCSSGRLFAAIQKRWCYEHSCQEHAEGSVVREFFTQQRLIEVPQLIHIYRIKWPTPCASSEFQDGLQLARPRVEQLLPKGRRSFVDRSTHSFKCTRIGILRSKLH